MRSGVASVKYADGEECALTTLGPISKQVASEIGSENPTLTKTSNSPIHGKCDIAYENGINFEKNKKKKDRRERIRSEPTLNWPASTSTDIDNVVSMMSRSFIDTYTERKNAATDEKFDAIKEASLTKMSADKQKQVPIYDLQMRNATNLIQHEFYVDHLRNSTQDRINMFTLARQQYELPPTVEKKGGLHSLCVDSVFDYNGIHNAAARIAWYRVNGAMHRIIEQTIDVEKHVEELCGKLSQLRVSKHKLKSIYNKYLKCLEEGQIHAQSGGDDIVRKAKQLEAITMATRFAGLGKNSKNNVKVKLKSKKKTHVPIPSFRHLDKMKDLSVKQKRSFKTQGLHAQSLFDVGIDANALAAITEIAESLRNISTSGVKIEHTAPSVWASLKDMFTMKNVSVLAGGLGVAFATYKFLTTGDVAWKTLLSLGSIVAMFSLPECVQNAANRLVSKVQDYFYTDVDEVHAQSHVDDITNGIIAYLYACIFKDAKMRTDPVSAFFKSAADMPRYKRGISDFINWTLDIAQRFLHFLSSKFNFDEYIIEKSPFPEAYQFFLDVEKLHKELFNTGSYNYENGQKFFGLQEKGRKLELRISDRTPEGKDAREHIRRALILMHPLEKKFQRSNIVNNGPRIAPLGVLIGGPSGCGKTHLITSMINQVTAAVLPEKDLDAFERNHNDVTFTRTPECGYWEGYHNQFNCYTDDLGQTKDLKGQPENEFMEHIRMLGPGSYPLNMATLEDKGTQNFSSRIVWATTNRKLFDLDSMYSNEPFCRRWNIAYVCVPVERWSRYDGDESNIWNRRLTHYPEDLTYRDHLEYHPWDVETGKITGPPITYKALIAEIIGSFAKQELAGKRMLEMHQAEKLDAINTRRIFSIDPKEFTQKVKDAIKLPEFVDDMTADFVVEKQAYEDKQDHVEDDIGSVYTNASSMEQITPNYTVDLDDYRADLLDAAKDGDFTRFSYRDLQLISDKIGKMCDIPAADVPRTMQMTYQISSEINPYMTIYELLAAMHSVHEETNTMTEDQDIGPIFKVCIDYSVKIGKTINTIGKLIKDWQKEIALYIGGLAVFRTACIVLNRLFPTTGQSSAPHHKRNRQTVSSKKGRMKGKTTRIYDFQKQGYIDVGSGKPEAQLCNDGGASDILTKLMKKGQYFIYLPDNQKPMGMINFVKPFVALCPLHFGERIKYGETQGEYNADTEIRIASVYTPNAFVSIPIHQISFVASERCHENDWCLLRIPEVINLTPDLLKYWAGPNALEGKNRFTVSLNTMRNGLPHIYTSEGFARKKPIEYEDYCIRNGIGYHIDTKVGDCGGLVALADPTIPCAKIIGIHVAGQNGRGFAPIITREDIEEVLECFDMPEPAIISDELEDVDTQIKGTEVPGFVAQCSVRKAPCMGISNIIKSPLHSTYAESKMAPAILRPVDRDGVKIDPLALARTKYCTPVKCLDPTVLNLVINNTLSSLMSSSEFGAYWDKPKVFTFEESIAGVPGVDFMDSIPRNTSAGYPWRLDIPAGHKGKSHFFGIDGDYTFESSHCIELRLKVDDIIQKAKNGVRKLHIFMDFLKDERRPFKKVETVSTRMISSCPIDLLIAFRMYFLDFMRWMMHNRIKNGSGVGINPYSAEWELLAKQMEQVKSDSDFMIAGDYSGWDGSTTAQLLRGVLVVINRWYNDSVENQRIRSVLWEEIVSSRHVFDDIVYEWMGSMPSGSPPTTIGNTIVNIFIINFVYVQMYMEHHKASNPSWAEAFRAYNASVRYACYGDDNLIAVNSQISGFFNQMTITGGMAKVGFKYTPEDKSDDAITRPYRPLEEVSFLKRTFQRSVFRYARVAPLELDVILEMPQWTHRKDHHFDESKVIVSTALRELSLHCKSVYGRYSKTILEASMDKLSFVPELIDYKELHLQTLASDVLL